MRKTAQFYAPGILTRWRFILILTEATSLPFLTSPSEEVDPTDPEVQSTIDQLLKEVAWNGVGLAAPQIGHKVCIAVMQLDHLDDPGNPVFMTAVINPTMIVSNDLIYGVEGCLSVPGKVFTVKRSRSVKLFYFDTTGQQHTLSLEGLPAIICQHEYDHLMGKLISMVGIPVVPHEEDIYEETTTDPSTSARTND